MITFQLNIRLVVTLICWSTIAEVKTQTEGYFDLRNNAIFDSIRLNEEMWGAYATEDSLNYTQLLLASWKQFKVASDTSISDRLLQNLSFVGDIESINSLSASKMAPYPQLDDTSYTNKFRDGRLLGHSARTYILTAAGSQNVVMFNEAHDRPQTRAFLGSLLADFRTLGFQNLALETFNESGNLKTLDASTGYYTAEPNSGDLVRTALELGYTLVKYEAVMHHKVKGQRGDTIVQRNLSINQREVEQAENLYEKIKMGKGVEKTLVLAGYGHILESADSSFTSMAMRFKKLSGINPFTIDQTMLIENNDRSPYAHRLISEVLDPDSSIVYLGAQVKRYGFDTNAVDLFVFHPYTKYIHKRPTWLLNLPDKYFASIDIPLSIKPVLVQAYLTEEISSDPDFNTRIPVDQTFYSLNDKAYLALRKDKEYFIVFRGADNRIVHKLRK